MATAEVEEEHEVAAHQEVVVEDVEHQEVVVADLEGKEALRL